MEQSKEFISSEISEDFRKNLKVLRKAKGWSQSFLGIEADLDRSNLSRIETGKHIPNIVTATKIARALKVSLDDMITSHDVVAG